jgi:hypothetical protein
MVAIHGRHPPIRSRSQAIVSINHPQIENGEEANPFARF